MSEPGDPSKAPIQWDQRYLDNDVPWDSGKPDVYLGQFMRVSSMKPCRALEVGCGTGTNAIWLDGLGFEVVGLDLSPTAIERASAKASAAGADCQLLVANFLIDPIPEGPFHFAYDRGVFHCFGDGSDRACFAGRVAEALDSGGVWHSLIGSTDGPPRNDGPPRRSAADIIAAVEPHFEILELKSTTFDEEGHQAKRAWLLVARKRAQVM
jgi:SAM-dependent methyltransferase